ERSLALAQVVDKAPLRNALESTAMRSLMLDRDLRAKIADLVDLEGVDASPKSLAERHKAAAEIQEAIASAKVRWKGWDPVRFGKLLGGSPALSLAEKLEIAAKIGKLRRKTVDKLTGWLDSLRAQLQEGLGSAFEPICDAFQQGYMVDIQSTHDM